MYFPRFAALSLGALLYLAAAVLPSRIFAEAGVMEVAATSSVSVTAGATQPGNAGSESSSSGAGVVTSAYPVCLAVPAADASATWSNTALSSSAWSSSADSATLPDAPDADIAPVPGVDYFGQAISGSTSGRRPLSALAVAVKIGVEGVGFDVATPLARKFNLRAGASFFSYTHELTEDGIEIDPNLVFRKAGASVDYYPFHGGFRLSPGVVFYNRNHATATAMVPGGQTFTLNDETYTSSTTDPVHGSAAIVFDTNKIAPSFTIGWGNMIPRSGRHWSVPFELGFEYVGQPTFTYSLAGTACNQYGCMNVATSPEIQSDIQAEQNTLNNDIAPLRFYPILSIGLGYKF